LQNILLSYEQKKLEILEEHLTTIQELFQMIYSEIARQSQRTITSLNDSSKTATFFKTKEKIREIRKETADEKISRMNRITKTNLQKMLNVIVVASIAAAAAAISQASSQNLVATEASSKDYRQQRR
jgi:Na+/phosphate symporter